MSADKGVLAGMTTAEARALVAACDGLGDNGGSRDKLLALAALGARCVGAKECWTPVFRLYTNHEAAKNNCIDPEDLRTVLVLEGE